MASSKASAFACEGLVEPLILRTYWSAEAWISSSVAGGSKLWRVRMFLHIGTILSTRYVEPLGHDRCPRQTLDRTCPALHRPVRGGARRLDRQRRPADDRRGAEVHREQPALGRQCLRAHLRRLPPARRAARGPARATADLHVRAGALRAGLAGGRPGEQL